MSVNSGINSDSEDSQMRSTEQSIELTKGMLMSRSTDKIINNKKFKLKPINLAKTDR